MKIKVISDIHNEFYHGGHYQLPVVDDESNITLIMAGDIAILNSEKTYKGFLDDVTKRFKNVFWIAGNHEFYHGHIDKHSIKKVIEENKWENLHTEILEVPEENVVIIGCTLWSDFDKGKPIVMYEANMYMNDYNLIRKGEHYSRLRAEDTAIIHHNQKKWMFDNVKNYSEKGYKVVVVTHHHPSFLGVPRKYEDQSLNGAYCSDLEKEIAELKIAYWFCGHNHYSQTYDIGNTKVVCNSLGYPHETGTLFNPNLMINV